MVPAGAGNLFTVNATVANREGAYRSGSAAMVSIPVGREHALLVPNGAIVREGDLTGVIVRSAAGDAGLALVSVDLAEGALLGDVRIGAPAAMPAR